MGKTFYGTASSIACLEYSNTKEFHFTKENCFALAGAKCRNSCRSVFHVVMYSHHFIFSEVNLVEHL